MKIVNRGYLLARPTNAFNEWAKQANPDLDIDINITEGSIYLIEEDFFEEEPVIEKLFKKILFQEFDAVVEDDSIWPEELTRELFNQFFTVEFGSMVFDAQKTDLLRD